MFCWNILFCFPFVSVFSFLQRSDHLHVQQLEIFHFHLTEKSETSDLHVTWSGHVWKYLPTRAGAIAYSFILILVGQTLKRSQSAPSLCRCATDVYMHLQLLCAIIKDILCVILWILKHLIVRHPHFISDTQEVTKLGIFRHVTFV